MVRCVSGKSKLTHHHALCNDLSIVKVKQKLIFFFSVWEAVETGSQFKSALKTKSLQLVMAKKISFQIHERGVSIALLLCHILRHLFA